MASLSVGDVFEISGPGGTWREAMVRRGRANGWQPRAWSSCPGDPNSEAVGPESLYVDFMARFEALEVRTSRRFVSARIEVNGRYVWVNVAKNGKDWVRIVMVGGMPSWFSARSAES